jgi:hypothetical protein
MQILKKSMAPVMLLALLLTILFLPSVATATVATNTVATATGTGTATFTTDQGDIQNLTPLAQSQLACQTRPPAAFIHGFFGFDIVRVIPGSSAIVTIALPSNMPVGTQYWKCIYGQWVNATSILGSNDGDNILTITLTDGGPFDADGVADGVIHDPGGPGIPIVIQEQPRLVSRPMPTEPPITVQNININPQQAYAGQPITITANMSNAGDAIAGYTAYLKINGQLEKTQLGTVDAHSAVPVNFTVTRSEPGTYAIDIGGQTGSFIVLADKASSGPPVNGAIIAMIIVAALIVGVVVVLTLTFRRTT